MPEVESVRVRHHRPPTLRVVMTGGGDFVGSHVLARMVGAGMDVTLIGPDTGESRYTASLVSAGHARFQRCEADFGDEPLLRTLFKDVDAVVLLGYRRPAPSSVATDFLDELSGNVAPTLRILRAAAGEVRHVVFASSVEVYGTPTRTPVRESDPASPNTPYAVAKLALEQAVRATCSAAGITASILRYATVYGPGESGRGPVQGFARAALAGQPLVIDGDGLDERDYIHVTDAVEATLAALRHRAEGTYNVGTGTGTATIDLARLVCKLSNANVSPVCRTWKRAGGGRSRVACDTELALSQLGFSARRALVDGMTEEIGWLRAQFASGQNTVLAASA
jgi:UDP-glucose 4-epimerase